MGTRCSLANALTDLLEASMATWQRTCPLPTILVRSTESCCCQALSAAPSRERLEARRESQSSLRIAENALTAIGIAEKTCPPTNFNRISRLIGQVGHS